MKQTVSVKGDARPGDEIVGDLPPTENRRFYPALDGLRAIAVLMVFLEHYELGFHPRLNWGWVGVDWFFVLSGFLITGILYDTRDTAHRFRNFYIRRTLRIFPLYYAVFAVALLLTPVFHFAWNRAWLMWALYLGNYVRFLYAHDPRLAVGALEHLRANPPFPHPAIFYVGHFWSLAVEEQFYLVWPVVVFTIRSRERLRTLCLLMLGVSLAARVVCVFRVPQLYLNLELLYRATPLRVDALLLGGCVALCLRGSEAARVRRFALPVLVSLAAGFAVFEGLYPLLSPRHTAFQPRPAEPVMSTIGFSLLDLFAASLIVCLLEPRGPLFRFFNLAWLRWLGQISYGFYVFHDIFHPLLLHVGTLLLPRQPRLQVHLTALAGLLLTTLLAYISFRFYEAPFLRLKERLSKT